MALEGKDLEAVGGVSVAAAAGRTARARPPGVYIAGFLKAIKPYRDLLALITGVIVAVSGSVSWVVSNFATQAQLQNLECRTTNDIRADGLNVQLGLLSADLERANARLAALNGIAVRSPSEIVETAALSNEIRDDNARLTQGFSQLGAMTTTTSCTAQKPGAKKPS